MSRIKIKDSSILMAGLYYLDPTSKTNKTLARGMLVGCMTMLMAQGLDYTQAIEVIKPYLPDNVDLGCVPEDWREDFKNV